MGLKWISENISKFYGDAADITLGGGSAGAAHVMTHISHTDSHNYFKNALVTGPPVINFWSEDQANTAYAYIATSVVNCTTSEDFATDLATGALLACLQAWPLEGLRVALDAASQIWPGLALQTNTLTQILSFFVLQFFKS